MLPRVTPLAPPATLDRNGPALPAAIADERPMPSGVFITDDPRPQCAPVMCNPAFFGSTSEGEGLRMPPQKVRDLRPQHGEIVEVSAAALESYAETIIQVRAELSIDPVDAVVVPLCGALRPASLVLPMGNFDLTMLPIPFTRGSSGLYDAQILDSLGEQLAPFYKRDPLTLGILDTGIGGQSLIHLVALLRELHDEATPHSEWILRCNIVIAADNRGYLDKANAVKRHASNRFIISRQVFPTQSLIAEDAKAAMPYQVDWGDPGAGYIQPVSRPGALVLRRPDGLEIHPTENIARSLDRQLAEATTRVLQKESNIFIRNIWEPGSDGVFK